MANQVIKDTFLNIYKDDYRDSDNYYQILFNNGRSLQQRELNQLQTILGKDIGSMGQFIFKPGAAAVGGGTSIISDAYFAKLNPSNPFPATPTSIEGEIFEESVSGILIKIIKIAVAVDSDPNTIYFTYVDSNGEDTGGTESVSLTPGRTLTGQTSGSVLKIQTTNTSVNPAFGKGSLFSLNSGRFYIDGHFVYSPNQTLILSKYTNTPTTTVGFKVTEDIVTVSDDENLYDNSGATLNISAPGADRYRVRLTLIEESDVAANDYFIKLAEITDGKISISQDGADNSALSSMGDYVAIRIHEESGNYTVQNFTVDFRTSDDDNSKFVLTIGEGKAYIEGHRFHVRSPIKTLENKPRSTKVVQNAGSTAAYGNYVVVDTLKGAPDLSTFEKVNLSTSTSDASGSVVGTARVRSIEQFGSNYKVYLFEVKMNSGSNFSSVRSVGDGDGTSSTFFAKIKVGSDNVARLFDLQNNNLFFPLPRSRAKSISDVLLTKQIIITGYSSDGSGEVTIPVTSGHLFDDASSWIVTRNDTGAVVSPTISISVDGLTADLSGLPNSTAITVLSYQQKSIGVVAQKTLKTRTQTISGITASTRIKPLDRADVYQLTSVVDATTSDDVTGRYQIDTGQRDNFYDVGSIELKTGRGAPSGNITVTYTYFDHGAGDFFAVNSYNGQVGYEDIPSHRQTNGEVIELRDVLDFRPRRSNNGTAFTGTGSQVFALPRNSDLINFDATYYLGIRGRVFLHRDSYAGILYGEPDFNPKFPDLGPGTMEIANVEFYPYMLNDEDLKLRYIDNKRFTMRDIGELEDRINELEELTSLTMLELQTQNLDVFDSSGLNRFKAGITADNFIDHSQSAVNDAQYRAALDPVRNELRPTFQTNAIELVFDSAESTNVRLAGDYVVLDYTDTVWQQQVGASRSVSVNEHPHPKMIGSISLSPSTDNWVDTERLPKKIVKGDDKISVKEGTLFGNHNLNWSGYEKMDLENYKQGDVLSSSVLSSNKSTAVTTPAAVGKDGVSTTTTTTSTRNYTLSKKSVVKESLGDFVRAKSAIPYMRSRFISFKATGLRPNTRHFIYFDDKDMSNWVNASSGTASFATMASLPRTSPYLMAGNIYKNETQFPTKLGGPTTTITTDSNGAISGYMLIPNTDAINFETGRKVFLVTDVQSPDVEVATSYSQFYYVADGILKQVQEEVLSTRVYQIVGATSIDSSTVTKRIPAIAPPPYVAPAVSTNYTAAAPAAVERDFTCFTPETLITMANGKKKMIKDIVSGEIVKGETRDNKVVGVETPTVGNRKIYGFSGIEPFVSEEHPLMTTNGWGAFNPQTLLDNEPEVYKVIIEEQGEVITLEEGMTVITESGNVKVENIVIEERDPSYVIYNLLLDGDHTYYANEILAHNKVGTCGHASDGNCGNTGGGSCFVAGSKVRMADGSIKLIEDVQIGEELLGMDNNINKVIEFDHPLLGDRNLYSFNGGVPFVTSEHPFMTKDGWKSINVEATLEEQPNLKKSMVGNLTVGDEILKQDGSYFKIVSIEEHTASNETQLYNFHLSGNNTYIVNDYLVHNKGGGKVICTALHSLGLLPDDIYELDARFGLKVNLEDPELGDGYRLWATPIAEYIKGNSMGSKIALAVVAPIARAWAEEMAHIMKPEEYKSNVIGKAIMAIGHPVCRAIGKIAYRLGHKYS